jgi:hypothetical protein
MVEIRKITFLYKKKKKYQKYNKKKKKKKKNIYNRVKL